MANLNIKVTFLLLIAIAVRERVVRAYDKKAIKKTIQSLDGDTIDCIDVYKQPSLDHPLLKNHTIKMKPTNRLGEDILAQRNNLSGYEFQSRHASEIVQTWRMSGAYPEGTIPVIRRAAAAAAHTVPSPNFLSAPRLSSVPQDDATPRQEWAIDYSFNNPYLGGSADMYLWDIWVDLDEYSVNYLVIEGGLPADDYDDGHIHYKSQIGAGWMVYPSFFQDERPRFFVYFTDDAKTTCLNHQCPGFVQTNPNYVLGGGFTNTSQIGGIQAYIVVTIRRETDDYKWWVLVNHEELGYYPGELFHDFYLGASVQIKRRPRLKQHVRRETH